MTRFLLACLLFAAALPVYAQSALSIVPTGGDYVSKGVARTYNSTNARFVASGFQNMFDLSVSGNDGRWWYLSIRAPRGENLRAGIYHFAERATFAGGRAAGVDFSGNGAGCNEVVGSVAIRQIVFDAQGNITRLEGTAIQYCESVSAPPLAIGFTYGAPTLSFSIGAPDFARNNRNYYGETSTFSLVTPATNAFQYKSSGQRDTWTMNFTAPTGQAQFAKGMYLTEGVAKTGVAGMDIALGTNRKAEYGKFEILTITYRNGAIVQLSARFWFYGDAARTKLLRSGRINFWK